MRERRPLSALIDSTPTTIQVLGVYNSSRSNRVWNLFTNIGLLVWKDDNSDVVLSEITP